MIRQRVVSWAEEYIYRPSICQRFISYFLLPVSVIWCAFAKVRRALKKPVDYEIPIISVGNLTVGGSGKTPVAIAIARKIIKPSIILRGYKRESKGLVVVSKFGKILCDVRTSGDEAMLYAKELENAIVIVSEDRISGILKAKELGAKVAVLDDGFGKINIKKFDILIRPNPAPFATFCIPSGAYRESISNYDKADLILEENINFERLVSVSNASEKMVLVTAIANPSRLHKYLPDNVVEKKIFADHHMYNKDELVEILHLSKAKSILTTTKDAVKMDKFNLPLSILKLDIKLSCNAMEKVEDYLKSSSNTAYQRLV